MTVQLELLSLTTAIPRPWPETILHAARAAVDINRYAGYAEFTTGTVTLHHTDDQHLVLATDNPWAANAVRTALLDDGHAVDSDPDHTNTTVTVWAIHHNTSASTTPPALGPIQNTGSKFVLQGPHGLIEQHYGPTGHNQLTAHAAHPFPAATRSTCPRHPDACWRRQQWPHRDRVHHLLANAFTPDGTAAWKLTPQAVQRLTGLYHRYIHATRP